MNFKYYCPECKEELVQIKNYQQCNNCLKNYIFENNCVVFKNYDFSQVSNNKLIKELIKKIKKSGFENGVKKFLITNNKLESQLNNTQYDKSVDVIFHGIGKKFSRCLNIRDELGNKSEILSNIFKQVYLIEFDNDSIELQNLRFKEREISNISITKSNLLKLPFPDNFFDLILCNEILDDVEKFGEKNLQKETREKIIQELKRIINDEGCIIFGINNNFNVKTKLKECINDFLGLKKGRFTKYFSILENKGLLIKPLWAFPSYFHPLFSGEISNDITLKGFFKNINSLISSQNEGHQGRIIEIILFIFKKMNYPFIESIIQIFSPSFVFCCWKNDNPKSLENWIKDETGYKNILRLSKHEKIIFMLLNFKGEIEKGVYIKRYGNEIPNEIKFLKREFPELKKPTERIWKVNWLKGRPVNSKNQNEVMATIDELIKFQTKTKSEIMNKDDAIKETLFIKKGLEYFGYKNIKYYEWLKQYEDYIEQNKINMTSVHGDFWFSNVIFDPKTKNINIIDWESCSEKGNPYEDFMWLLCNFMGMSSKNPILKFKKYLEGNGEMNKMMEQMKNKINLHFGFKLDFILLLRINLMKWMIIQKQINEKNSSNTINSKESQRMKHAEMLEILSKY